MVQVMPNRQGFLLQKIGKGTNHIILINQQTFDWARQLERDMTMKSEYLLQQPAIRRDGRTHFHFVYVSDLLPVDDWEHLLSDRQIRNSNKLLSSLYLLDEPSREDVLTRLLDNTGSEPKALFSELPSIEEQEKHTSYLEQQMISKHHREQREMKETFQFGKPKWTFFLIIMNVLMFVYIETVGSSTNTMDLIEYGAKYNPAIVDGEWWRIFTSMFLHIGVLHLFMNMLALYFLGEAVERIFGSKRFLFIYFLGGIFGGVASFATNDAIAAGASGAIFGLFGALLFFGIHHKRLFLQTMGTSLFVVIGINIAFGFMVPQIDNGAHLGGLIGGFIASQIIHLPKKRERIKQLLALIVYVGVIGFLVMYGLDRAQNTEDPNTLAMIAQNHIAQGEYDETIELIDEAMGDDLEHAYLYFYRGVAYFENAELELAEADFQAAIEIDENFAEAHYNLAVIYSRYGEFELAKEHASKAVEFQTDDQHQDFEEFYQRLQEMTE